MAFVLIPCLVCLVPAKEKKTKTDREWNHLKGPAKTLIYQDAPPADDPDGLGEEVMQPFVQRRTITYDIHGKKIKEEPQAPTCGMAWLERQRKHIRQYDDHGNLIKELTYERDGRLVHKDIWSYDAEGNMLTWSFYDGLRLKGKWVNICDEKGDRVEATSYGRKMVLDHREVYECNEQRDIIEYTWYRQDGSVGFRHL